MVLLLGLLLPVRLVFFEASPTSSSITARPHSHIDLLYFLFKVALVLFFVLAPSLAFGFVLCIFLGSLLFVFSRLVYLPYYSLYTNCFGLGFNFVITYWAGLALGAVCGTVNSSGLYCVCSSHVDG